MFQASFLLGQKPAPREEEAGSRRRVCFFLALDEVLSITGILMVQFVYDLTSSTHAIAILVRKSQLL